MARGRQAGGVAALSTLGPGERRVRSPVVGGFGGLDRGSAATRRTERAEAEDGENGPMMIELHY